MMHIAHHPIFVALSMIIACLGSWTALDLFRRVRAHTGTWRGAWLLAASIAMGLSIWAMHFIAMLGFNPGAEVRYDIGLTLLSLLLAIAVTALAFFSAARGKVRRLVLSGLGMGVGICTMHYVGMAAMITELALTNDPLFVVLAVAVAVSASTGALIAAMHEHTFLQRALAAIVLGFAIVGMHYTAMVGVQLSPDATAMEVSGGIDSVVLAFGIAGGTFFILFLALIAALSDRRFEAMAAVEAARSEQRLRAIVEHLPLGILVVAKPFGEIRYANDEASRLVGHTVAPGIHWSDIQIQGNVDGNGERTTNGDILDEALQQKRRAGPRLLACRQSNGSITQIEVTVAPIPHYSDGGDGSTQAIVALQDVTEKLRAEKERQEQEDLRRLNELLEERVAAALAEKAQAQAALLHRQRLDSLGHLTGGVAHDFNNLLTVVIGALDIILRHPEHGERRARLGEAALAAAKRGQRLTAQLLAFARQQPLHPESCDLNELIRVGEPLIRRAVGEEIALTLHLSREPIFALIDPAQFEATLLNLVVNAVDACHAGCSISIETSQRDGLPEAIPDTPTRYFQLRITDTGKGMSADVLNRIFDPFFTTKAPGKGTGLGLSQVYGFVKQSGGEVRVDSQEGQGTTFEILIPAIEERTSDASARRPLKHTVRSLSVLLTEDDPAVATIVEAMLMNLGHGVVRTENAEQALAVLRSQRPVDLLLSDIVMPGGVNGLELAQQAVAIRPGLQVLLSSGYAGESVDQALAQSRWPFLKKPYAEEELAAHLEQFSQFTAERIGQA
jgi:PAS domain S-box-containing protein